MVALTWLSELDPKRKPIVKATKENQKQSFLNFRASSWDTSCMTAFEHRLFIISMSQYAAS